MTAYPGIERIPDYVWVGQIGDCYATAETEDGAGLVVFLDRDCHTRSSMPESLKGTCPLRLSRREVMDLCDVCYLVDPDADAFVCFHISDKTQPAGEGQISHPDPADWDALPEYVQEVIER